MTTRENAQRPSLLHPTTLIAIGAAVLALWLLVAPSSLARLTREPRETAPSSFEAVATHVARTGSSHAAEPALDERRIAELADLTQPYGEEVFPEEAALREQRTARGDARFDALRARLETEPRDTIWAPKYEDELRGHLRERSVGQDAIESLQCAATICRVRLRLEDNLAFSGLTTMPANLDRPFTARIEANEGVPRVELYVERFSAEEIGP